MIDKDRIKKKIFSRPRHNDCFRRLSKVERRYIIRNTGFSDLERKVFDLLCKGLSFIEISQELNYHLSYCKKIAARVREKILELIS